MSVTHKLLTSVENYIADTTGFEINTNCKSVLIDNTGDDTVTIYFNNNDVNGYPLKAGSSIPVNADTNNEAIYDIIKLVFEGTGVSPNVSIVKQTKTLSI